LKLMRKPNGEPSVVLVLALAIGLAACADPDVYEGQWNGDASVAGQLASGPILRSTAPVTLTISKMPAGYEVTGFGRGCGVVRLIENGVGLDASGGAPCVTTGSVWRERDRLDVRITFETRTQLGVVTTRFEADLAQ
jgi:hypothetical protein